MTQDHPITPPPELFKQWVGMPRSLAFGAAYRAGADMELRACCEWVSQWCGRWPDGTRPEDELRAARRPKPPSDKQEALSALEQIDGWAVANMSNYAIYDDLVKGVDTIRRALEALPDD